MSKISILKRKQKEEAVKRMKKLSLHPIIIVEFINKGTIHKSEHIGFLSWLNDKEKKIVKEFEKERNSVVYHIIKNHTEFGTLLTIFYVSPHTDEWSIDNEDIKLNRQLCYVKNLDVDYYSEYGYICFQKNIGGLIRTT